MKVMVTGGNGFFGKPVVRQFRERGHEVFVPSHSEYDLRDGAAIRRALTGFNPNSVVHLAAAVGGIGANAAEPGRFFYDNALMGIQLIHYSMALGVKKFVTIGTVCEYPEFTPVPFREDDLWAGYPTPVTAPYGLAKKMLLVQGQAYREQYGFDSIHLIPTNLYGPGDNFDPETGHVIPALIRKFSDAMREGDDAVYVWGSGKAAREFIYIEDAARAVVLATLRYSNPEPVNIGYGHPRSIAHVAELLREIYCFKGEIRWDESRPDGQLLRQLDVSRAQDRFGFTATTGLEEGLRNTVEWFEETR